MKLTFNEQNRRRYKEQCGNRMLVNNTMWLWRVNSNGSVIAYSETGLHIFCSAEELLGSPWSRELHYGTEGGLIKPEDITRLVETAKSNFLSLI